MHFVSFQYQFTLSSFPTWKMKFVYSFLIDLAFVLLAFICMSKHQWIMSEIFAIDCTLQTLNWISGLKMLSSFSSRKLKLHLKMFMFFVLIENTKYSKSALDAASSLGDYVETIRSQWISITLNSTNKFVWCSVQ